MFMLSNDMVFRSHFVGRGRSMFLEEVMPMTSNLEHDLGVHASTRCGLLDRQTSLLKHGVALLFALLNGPLDLVGVESAGVG